jgi:DNA-binding Lrp family transcriptional regulator
MNKTYLQNRAPQRSTFAAGRIRERIISLLLAAGRGHPRTAYAIAKAAGCTAPYAYAYIGKLESEGLLRRTAVVRPRALIEQWRAIRERPPTIDFFVPNQVALLVPAPPMPYAASTYLAESRRYHYLVPVRWDLYIREADLADWAAACQNLGGLRGPGNVRLLVGDPWIAENSFEEGTTVDPGVGRDPLKWVGDPRLVLDLLVEGSVCVEAAELIMKRRGWGGRTQMPKRI